MTLHLGHLTSPLTAPLPSSPDGCYLFSFQHDQDYAASGAITLYVLYDSRCEQLLLSEQVIDPGSDDTLTATAEKLGERVLDLSKPLSLGTVTIPKPWGAEIWYTGIEARGVCDIEGVSLAWFSDALAFLGRLPATHPILLKILAPKAEPVTGDLYFELHEEKQEIYIVTGVDHEAWPDGVGKLRYGFNLDKDEDRDSFVQNYRTAVADYEQVRRQIDEGPADNAESLVDAERERRAHMDSFTRLIDVNIGDVIRIARHVPHALQHGVRVIEFQTPHYERYILSFGQEVVTQDHWDTDEGLSVAVLDAPDPIQRTDDDVIAAFDDFIAYRYQLAPGEKQSIARDSYALIIGVAGETKVSGRPLAAEEALYLTPGDGTWQVENGGEGTATCLVAVPSGGA